MEQRLIDADRLISAFNKNVAGASAFYPLIDMQPTVNAIVIHDNATTGDMIKAMFPNLRVEEEIEGEPRFVKIYPYNDGGFFYLLKELWNSPYKRGE